MVPGTAVEVRLVVDRSVAELYLPSGRTLTLRFYSTGGAPWRIEARSTDEGGLGYAVGAWNLRPYTMRHAADASAESARPEAGPVRP